MNIMNHGLPGQMKLDGPQDLLGSDLPPLFPSPLTDSMPWTEETIVQRRGEGQGKREQGPSLHQFVADPLEGISSEYGMKQ